VRLLTNRGGEGCRGTVFLRLNVQSWFPFANQRRFAPSRPDFRHAKADAAKTGSLPDRARSFCRKREGAHQGQNAVPEDQNLCELPRVILRYSGSFLKAL